jgi:hypothetical protein
MDGAIVRRNSPFLATDQWFRLYLFQRCSLFKFDGTGVNDNGCTWTDQGTPARHIAPGNSDYSHLTIQNLKSGALTSGCGSAVGIWIDDPFGSGLPKSVRTATINSPSSLCNNGTPTSNIRVSGFNATASGGGAITPMTISDIHTEICTNGVDIGLDQGAQGIVVDSIGSACSYAVHIENTCANATVSQVGDLLLRNIIGCCHVMKDRTTDRGGAGEKEHST